MNDIQDRAQKFLLRLKMGEDFQRELANMKSISKDDFFALSDDDAKKTFWINCYNAFFLYLRREEKIEKPLIYKEKLIHFKEVHLGLDDIEHGILRRYRIKKSLGYLPNVFAPKIIKQLSVDALDFRIHFALNCGATSCPPIAFYNRSQIDAQLEIATRSFLESETTIDHRTQEVKVSSLFKWYLGDFGGRSGIRRIIAHYLDIDVNGYGIVYAPYDYSEDLENFR